MLVVYVCGYGRSGSTLLGNLWATRDNFVHVGEVANVAHRHLDEHRQCSCGLPLTECAYWGSVIARLSRLAGERPSAVKLPPVGALEGWWGLLVPGRLLRTVVKRRAFSIDFPTVSFAHGLGILLTVAGGTIIDSSKTTRKTANRPRLLRAAGAEVKLVQAWRPLGDVIESHREATIRTGNGPPRCLSPLVVTLNRLLAHLAAGLCARALRIRNQRWTLERIVLESGNRPGPRNSHLFGGNRRQLNSSDD